MYQYLRPDTIESDVMKIAWLEQYIFSDIQKVAELIIVASDCCYLSQKCLPNYKATVNTVMTYLSINALIELSIHILLQAFQHCCLDQVLLIKRDKVNHTNQTILHLTVQS